MKKTAKKLMLAKETVQKLDNPGLGKVAGGYSTDWWTCLCESNEMACPLTRMESCISC